LPERAAELDHLSLAKAPTAPLIQRNHRPGTDGL